MKPLMILDQIDKVFDDTFEETHNVDEAIFIFPDGKLASGEYDMGIRGLDHNTLASELDMDDWSQVQAETGVVRLVPESRSTLIAEGQELTASQAKILSKTDYEISKYVEKYQAPSRGLDEIITRSKRVASVATKSVERPVQQHVAFEH